MPPKIPVYLALQGGGVRGFAHLGALATLETAIDAQGYSGTSIGSFIAALMAAGYTSADIQHEMRGWDLALLIQKRRRRIRMSLKRPGAAILAKQLDARYDYDSLLSKLEDLLAQKAIATFGDLKRHRCPFLAIVACQLGDSDPLAVYRSDDSTFDQMKIVDAVSASMAAPVYFTPKMTRGRLTIDGGLVSNLPLLPFRELASATGIPVVALEFLERGTHGDSFVELLAPLMTAISTSLNRHAMPAYTPVPIDTSVRPFDFSVLKSMDRVTSLIMDGQKSADRFMKNVALPALAPPEQGGYYYRRRMVAALNGLRGRVRACGDASIEGTGRVPNCEAMYFKYYAYQRVRNGNERFEPVASCVECEKLEAGHSYNPEEHIGFRYDSRASGNGGGVVWLAKDILEDNSRQGRNPFHSMPYYFAVDCASANVHLSPPVRTHLRKNRVRSIATVPICNRHRLYGVVQVCSDININGARGRSKSAFFGSPLFDETLKAECARFCTEVERWTAEAKW